MRFVTKLGVAGALAALAWPAVSISAEMRGVTATEIKIGQTMPYSGPVSAFGALGKGEVAYFKMLNEQGGINGRKINLISLDDSYAPPKTVEQTRRLVESDEVALIFSSIGTAHNTAIAKYLQGKNIPQLFVGSGASKFADIAQYPQATLGVQGPFRYEARLYARYALAKNPDAKFAVISQNDDFGRDYLLGLKDVLGDKYDQLVTAATYEVQDPTVDSQIVKLKASGADVLVIAATPKFAAQSIRKVYEIGWKPMTFLSNVAVWISTVMQPAGLEAGTGILSTAYVKDPDDPAWKDDAGVKAWREFMVKYAARCRPARHQLCQRLQQRDGDGARAEGLRRRSVDREYSQASLRHQGSGTADAAARHQDQHFADRSRPGRPDAVHALQRQGLGPFRRIADGKLISRHSRGAAGRASRPRRASARLDRSLRLCRRDAILVAPAGLGRAAVIAPNPCKPPRAVKP